LRSHLNQSWSDVYSRLCQELDPRTMAGRHVIDHLWNFVALHVEIVDGIPYSKPTGKVCDDYFPLIYSYHKQFYVHPDSGLLCRVPRFCTVQKPQPEGKDRVVIDANTEYRQIDNLWYLITFESIPCHRVWDVLLKDTIDVQKARLAYGRNVYAAKKRQCGKQALKMIRKAMNS